MMRPSAAEGIVFIAVVRLAGAAHPGCPAGGGARQRHPGGSRHALAVKALPAHIEDGGHVVDNVHDDLIQQTADTCSWTSPDH